MKDMPQSLHAYLAIAEALPCICEAGRGDEAYLRASG